MDKTDMMDSPGHRLLRWERGETPGPWFVSLFPTNRCNLKCSICWQRRVDVDHSSEISDERLLHFVDECAELGAKEWVIVGGGEPMVRDELVIQMCERIRAHGMDGRIQTNGVRFREEHFERLIKAQWKEVVFSLDGPTAEINDRIRSAGSFANATSNLKKFSELRKKSGSSFPETFVTAVVTSTNYDKFDQMADLVHELGCDGLRGGHLTPESELSLEFQLSPEQTAGFPKHLERAMKRAEELGLKHGLYELLPDASAPASGSSFPPLPPKSSKGIECAACLEPWLGIQVQPYGYVGPCCIFWDTKADSIKDMSLRDVWLGPYLQKVRADFLNGRFQPYCVSCHSSFRVHDVYFRHDLALAREQDVWRHGGAAARAKLFGKKALDSIRRNGLSGAMKRGMHWLRLLRGR